VFKENLESESSYNVLILNFNLILGFSFDIIYITIKG